ncbi:MAG: FMN-binding protein [Enterocloster sp.]
MNKGNITGLAVMAVASAVLIAVSNPLYNAIQNKKLQDAAGGQEITTASGEAEGYGGAIKAEVTMAGGKILDLTLTGEKETPDVGGAAMSTLKDAILEKQGLEGVDAVSGATWTSKGVFAAVQSAMGIETDGAGQAGTETEKGQEAIQASGLEHGLGFCSSGRLGPGKDDQGTGVYSLNEVVAYVLFDGEGKILDLEVDQLEVATPNYDGEYMPKLTGFPGQSYNADEDHDEKVDAVLVQDDESYLAQVASWKTKRERGTTYKLNSGTWTDEMDLFEEKFKGMTVEEVKQWYADYCSDLNGKPLHGTSDKEEDIRKYETLSEEQKAELDAISGATMSLNDAHGNIIGAIVRAYENRRPVNAEKVAKIGLGFTNTGRLGPGKDDQETGVYSFNTQAAGACFDENGAIAALYTDVMEVATPNYDGEFMPKFTGFPGQSYNADEDHDEKVDTVLEQTEDTFLAQVDSWKTKRERGTTYKLNSGTWTEEMDLFEEKFTGMTAEEVQAWFDAYCSDLNGKPLHGTSDKEEDIRKYEALNDSEKAELDAISGATMSLRDAHGDLLGAITKAWDNAKSVDISAEK